MGVDEVDYHWCLWCDGEATCACGNCDAHCECGMPDYDALAKDDLIDFPERDA